LYDGLLEHAFELDIHHRKGWSNADAVEGRCAVVTCTDLLTCLGCRNPESWQDCLELAYRLLAPGGVSLTFDATDWGGYGDLTTMQKFIQSKKLPLSPKTCSDLLPTGKWTMRLVAYKKDDL